MSRVLADPLYERLLRAYPPDQPYTPADWADAPMPGPLRHFLQHRLRHQQRQEVQRLRQAHSNWVRADHPAVREAQHDYLQAIAAHLCVPADAWSATLQQAARHVTAYLVRPVPVLLAFFFGSNDAPCPVERARWRMRYFDTYDGVHEAVETFIQKRDARTLEREPLKTFLYRVEAKQAHTHDAEDWLHLLSPLFSMARVATDRAELPVSVLRTFFAQKDATAHANRVEAYAEQHDANRLSARQMRDMLTEAAEAPQASTAPPAPVPNLDDLDVLDDLAEATETEEPKSTPEPDPQTQTRETSSGPAEQKTQAASAPDANASFSASPEPDARAETPSAPEPSTSKASTGDAPDDAKNPRNAPAEPASEEELKSEEGPASEEELKSEEQPSASSWPPPEYAQNWPSGDEDSAEDSETAVQETSSNATADDSDTPFDWSGGADADSGDAVSSEDTASGTQATRPPAEDDTRPDAAASDDAADESTPLWKRFHRSTDQPRKEEAANAKADSDSDNTPLWARFRPAQDASNNAPQDAPERSPDENPQAEQRPATGTPDRTNKGSASQPSASQPGRSQTPGPSAGASSGALAALEQDVIGRSDTARRSEYVRHLFDDSIEDYRTVLDLLQNADTWAEASRIIAREVFRAHHVNIYSDVAVRFTEDVEAQFR